jgi:capsule polysaccharide export protein KpsE/RkpR
MLETLRSSLAAVIAKNGKDAPSAQDLQAQIASLERQARQQAGTEQPRENPVSFRGK